MHTKEILCINNCKNPPCIRLYFNKLKRTTADRGVVKESKISTDYSNTYFGYSLKSDVKPKKSTKEDYKLGYIIDKKFVEGISASDFLGQLHDKAILFAIVLTVIKRTVFDYELQRSNRTVFYR